jgi:hypothetical protein
MRPGKIEGSLPTMRHCRASQGRASFSESGKTSRYEDVAGCGQRQEADV